MPILGKGENYIYPDEVRSGSPISDSRPNFDYVKLKIKSQVADVKEQLKLVDHENRLSEVVVNFKMSLGYSAKSYHPKALINAIDAKEVGTKKWEGMKQTKKGEELRTGKDIFLRLTDDKLEKLENILSLSSEDLPDNVVNDIRTLEEIYLDTKTSLLNTFTDNWNEGRVEVVLHPFDILEDEVIDRFKFLFKKYGGEESSLKIRSYSPGPIFISAYVNKKTLEHIIKFNPVRTCHPLEFRGLPNLKIQESINIDLPHPPNDRFSSTVKVGVFDGGVNLNSPYVKDFVNEHNPVNTNKDIKYIQHGLGVSGAILYGDLRDYDEYAHLPTPLVNVESYRVLPLTDSTDFDLYDVIDTIESVVPSRSDIKVFNLSIGPYGPIEDDYISRFTYVIDDLSKNGERLFVVAVGNDGDLSEGSNRIQSPSDTVNGLGVGAYSLNGNFEKERASYSCVGSGREGSKIKPDILDFGGSNKFPFHLLGLDGKHRYLACGTSFAAPLVSKKAAEVMGLCNMVDPLTAKALIVNSAQHPQEIPNKYYGYGLVPKATEEILGCTENKISVLYRSRILPKKYAKLEIPVIGNLDYTGKVKIQWTIVVAANPNPVNTEDYTSIAIEDTFYPNNNKYKLKAPPGVLPKSKTLNIHTQKKEVDELISQGWEFSKYPITHAPIKPMKEEERKIDFKWDTILRKEATLNYSSLENPYLVLHAMDRYVENNISGFFNYSVVVSVEYLTYVGEAYLETVKQFNRLEMAHIRNRNDLIIRN